MSIARVCLLACALLAMPVPLVAQTAFVAPATHAMPQIGMLVFSSDGNKIGTIESIDGIGGGRAITIATGSLLGFGVKLVRIPEEKFTVIDQHVRVELTVDDIAALPHQGP